MNNNFWINKKIFVTGHTGFKGSWLCLWLHKLGAKVTGYALPPPTNPSLFELCDINSIVNSIIGDVRDSATLSKTIQGARPEIIFHMAAQPLVRESYKRPVDTYATNVMGTVNLFEAIRECKSVRAVVNVTTDKCYENKEWSWGYKENEPLGGYDPYSSSKACSELVTSAYRNSFFGNNKSGHFVAVASARAGNVIGGGDWADDRLIPDCIRSIIKREHILIRNPASIRPWQHVLEPLRGYMMLAQKLYEDGAKFSESWNFGPHDDDAKPVEWIVKRLCERWGTGASYKIDDGLHPHEAQYLKLDCSKVNSKLGWCPKWNLEKALDSIIEWTKSYSNGENLRSISIKQIEEYSSTAL